MALLVNDIPLEMSFQSQKGEKITCWCSILVWHTLLIACRLRHERFYEIKMAI